MHVHILFAKTSYSTPRLPLSSILGIIHTMVAKTFISTFVFIISLRFGYNQVVGRTTRKILYSWIGCESPLHVKLISQAPRRATTNPKTPLESVRRRAH